MAGASLLTLLDDIATLLDDVSVMTKVAAQKTAGVLGDDLAVNAEQVAGMSAERELPVVWAVAKGSFWNKVILVPSALLITTLYPPLLRALMLLGGAYLAFEGIEKVWDVLFPKKASDVQHRTEADGAPNRRVLHTKEEILAFEQEKIQGAIRTDFVLSAEIVVISLGTLGEHSLTTKIATLSTIAVLMTAGVYGFVACIVKLDDLGLFLMQKRSALARALGLKLLVAAPLLMRGLTIVGTAAMFLVGGGLLVHNLPESWAHHLPHWEFPKSMLLETFVGILLGLAAKPIMDGAHALKARRRRQ